MSTVPLRKSCYTFLLSFLALWQVSTGRSTNTVISMVDALDGWTYIGSGFGFDVGGTLYMSINVTTVDSSLSNSTFYFALVTESQANFWESLQSDSGRNPNVFPHWDCYMPSALRYEFQNSLEFNYVIPQRNLYYPVLLNCARHDMVVNTAARYLNPVASVGAAYVELGVQDKPFVDIYSALLTFYIFFTIVWVGMLAAFYRRTMTGIHRAFLFILIVKLLENVVNLMYIKTVAETSWEDDTFSGLSQFATVVADTIFLGFLLLIALGWRITRQALTARERQLFVGTFLPYLGFGGLQAQCTGQEFCGAYVLSVYVINSLILLGVIVAMNFTISQIRMVVQDASLSGPIGDLYIKLKVYQYYRWVFLVYLMLPTALLIISVTVFTWEYQWIGTVIREVIVAAILVVIGTNFRPRSYLYAFDLGTANAVPQAPEVVQATATGVATQTVPQQRRPLPAHVPASSPL
eukprot:GILK01007556.1.p1 GENE.GILK01007556.1~~GILK01007556.1.p1  ORF type:complete len:464 (+),score=23.54 GILK01007556.1:49-1440(+)